MTRGGNESVTQGTVTQGIVIQGIVIQGIVLQGTVTQGAVTQGAVTQGNGDVWQRVSADASIASLLIYYQETRGPQFPPVEVDLEEGGRGRNLYA